MKNIVPEKKLPENAPCHGADTTMNQLGTHGLVSVIIPVFNVRPYLVEALDSVISQTYTNLEIIIIDDGSTDGSGEICDEYTKKDARVCVIHQENKGLSTARNVGLDRMTGEVVVFLDPDDAYHPDYVKVMMDAMLRENADIVKCRYTIHKTTGKMRQTFLSRARVQVKPGMYDRIDALRALADRNIETAVWDKMYRRELWREIRFPDGYVYEGTDTTYRIIDLCRSFYVLDQRLYLHRNRPGSITNTRSWKNSRDSYLAISHFSSFIEAHTPEIFSLEQLRKSRQSCLNSMIHAYICRSEKAKEPGEPIDEEMKRMIIEKRKEIGVEITGLKTRTAYWMLLYFPCLLRLAYPVYRPVHLFVRRVMGC